MRRCLSPCLMLTIVTAACSSPEPSPDTSSVELDTGEWSGPIGDEGWNRPYLTELSYDCDLTTPDAWTYSLRTALWTAGATMNIYHTSSWDPSQTQAPPATWIERGHHYSQGTEAGVDYEANGEWDRWGVTLAVVDDASDVAPGTTLTTRFGCDLYDNDPNKAGVAWRVYVYHDDDTDPETAGIPADCWVFGFETSDIDAMDQPDSLCHDP